MKTTKKKRNFYILLSIVLMFTLVSACLMGGTLAKYVTSGAGGDTARVAKWGVEVSALETGANGLFKTEYAAYENGASSGALSVKTSPGENVVAPGTGEKGVSGFSVSGMPEVACRLTVDASASSISGWDYDPGGVVKYEPVLWTLTDPLGSEIVKNGTFADLKAALDEITFKFDPLDDLAAKFGSYTIDWSWPFAGDDAGDTYYGNKASAPTIFLSYVVTITQID